MIYLSSTRSQAIAAGTQAFNPEVLPALTRVLVATVGLTMTVIVTMLATATVQPDLDLQLES